MPLPDRETRSRFLFRWGKACHRTPLVVAAGLTDSEATTHRQLMAAGLAAGLVALSFGDSVLLRPPGRGRQRGRMICAGDPLARDIVRHLPAWVAQEPQRWLTLPLEQLARAPGRQAPPPPASGDQPPQQTPPECYAAHVAAAARIQATIQAELQALTPGPTQPVPSPNGRRT